MIRTQGWKRPPKKEAEIQDESIEQLMLDGWLVVRINGGGFEDKKGTFVRNYIIHGLNAIAGFPDCLALRGDVKGGRFLLIEFKTEKGELTPAQQKFHNFAARFGIKVHICRDKSHLKSIYEKEKP